MKLGEYRGQIYTCVHCGYCRDMFRDSDGTKGVCPVGMRKGFESYYPRGRMLIAKAIFENLLEYDKAVADRLFTCTTCGNCEVHCPAEIEHTDIVETMRQEMLQCGVAPLQPHSEMIEDVLKNKNPYGEPHASRFKFLPDDVFSGNADTVYFVGCTSSYRQQELAKATIELLRRSTCDFMVLKDEECCCSPLLRIGARDVALDFGKRNVKRIEETGAKRVLFSCAGCYRTFKRDYPKLIGDLGFEISHVSEYLMEALKEGRLTLSEMGEVTVTYHDPCHLGRGVEVYEPPRRLLEAIPGVRVIEMDTNRANAICCGAGGGVRKAFPDLAKALAGDRLAKAEATGAQILSSACPFCKSNLEAVASSSGSRMEILDVVELALRASNEP